MPYIGDIYTLLSGSKGTPNTTIQSAPYNAQLDDFASAMNAKRPISAGGTNATNATDARANLGVAIGTNVQAYDALLQAIAGLTTSANQIIYTTGVDTVAVAAISAFGRSLIDDTDAATARATIGANDAGNLTTGTVNDSRLPASMAGKTFTTSVSIDGTAAAARGFNLRTSGLLRWVFGANSVSETGGNVGSDFFINRYDDAGNYVSTPFQILRSTGAVSIAASLSVNGSPVWTSGNDGAGSGLDADLLDGQEGSYYTNIIARLGYTPLNSSSYTAADVLTKIKTVDGAGSGLDADLLDGQEGSYYLNAANLTGTVPSARLSGIYAINVSGNAGTITGQGQLATANFADLFGTWQDLTASRAGNTSYQNTTGKWLNVAAAASSNGVAGQVSVNGTTWITVSGGGSGSWDVNIIVPPNWFYRVTGAITSWAESRV